MRDNIFIGTAGYSYDDWEGYFYPEGLKKGGERIKMYVEKFNTLEINSTYYRLLSSGYFWFVIKNTPKDFPVIIKMHKNITHLRESFKDTRVEFNESVKPFHQTGREFFILFQFPYSFKFNLENMEYLKRIALEFPHNKAIEFRHVSWNHEEVFPFLDENKFVFVNVDTPPLEGLFPSGVTQITNPTSYLRLHGRNSKKWWKADKGYERYNYLYSQKEIDEEIRKRIIEILKKSDRVIVIFNNHYQAKAVKNALMLKDLL